MPRHSSNTTCSGTSYTSSYTVHGNSCSDTNNINTSTVNNVRKISSKYFNRYNIDNNILSSLLDNKYISYSEYSCCKLWLKNR